MDEIACVGSRRAGNIIMEMSTKAEQRSYGRELGDERIVFIQNLLEVWRQDYDAALSFESLLRNGGERGVYTIATVDDPDNVKKWLPAFKIIEKKVELFEAIEKKPKRFFFF